MRYKTPRSFVFCCTFCCLALFQFHTALSQTVVQSPDQILAEATQASLKADYKTALSKTRQARAASPEDLSFAVRFIPAVVSMADLSDARHQSSFFNEALKAANKVELSKIADGNGDAEFSWHYMVAVGKLADSLSDISKTTASKLYVAQAKVAKNLQKNPGFPQVSLSLLSDPLMGQAYASAIEKDVDGTLKAMTIAFDAGFTNFESLLDNRFVKALKSESVDSMVKQKLSAYEKQLAKWARESVAEFKSFDFKFDVADIDAGRISNSDFEGRILVLDLWATWCQPCREAIPHFVKLDEEFRGENVDIVGISMDSPDDPGKSLKVVRKFVDENGVEYAMAMGNRSVMNQLAPEQKLPTVLFIDTQGKVRFIAEGPHNFYQLSAITNELINQEEDSSTGFPRFFGQY